jgi:hypothetical protein
MNAPQHRPAVDFFQSPMVTVKAAEVAILTILENLVRKGVLSEQEALATFNNIPLLQGVNSAHEIGLTLRNWQDVLAWRFKAGQKAAEEPKNAPAAA